jgi:hypothetical protein
MLFKNNRILRVFHNGVLRRMTSKRQALNGEYHD